MRSEMSWRPESCNRSATASKTASSPSCATGASVPPQWMVGPSPHSRMSISDFPVSEILQRLHSRGAGQRPTPTRTERVLSVDVLEHLADVEADPERKAVQVVLRAAAVPGF